MSDFVHRTEKDSYAHDRPLDKGGPADLGPAMSERVLGISASTRYLGAALVADGRVLRLFAQRLPKDRATADGAIRALIADLVRSHGCKTTVVVIEADTDESVPMPVHETVSRVCSALCVEIARMEPRAVANACGLDAESVIEIARHMAAHDPVVRSYLAPRGHGPRSEVERYWEHAAIAAAASLSLQRETTPPPC